MFVKISIISIPIIFLNTIIRDLALNELPKKMPTFLYYFNYSVVYSLNILGCAGMCVSLKNPHHKVKQ